jgi:hypothetical protein
MTGSRPTGTAEPNVASWTESSSTGAGAALAILGVGALAAALRLIGLQYGLPAVYNPDEVAIMARALSFATGTLNPHNFLYPTFYFYVLFAWVGVYLAFVWVSGGVESIHALSRLYFAAPEGIYTAGRLLGVVAGTASVFLVYRLGRRIADIPTALAAAMLLAVAPLHVRDSHYVKHDVAATLCVVLAVLLMARLIDRGTAGRGSAGSLRTRDTVLAGSACGLALSTHYYCVFLGLPLAISVISAWRDRGPAVIARQLAIAGVATIVVFFALSPFILVEPVTAWRDIVANRQIVVDRAVAEGAFAPARRYAQMLVHDAMGAPALVLAAVGVVWMMFATPVRAMFLLAFPVPFLLFIANTAPASRYLNPVLPFMALFAAWAIASMARRARRPAVLWIVVGLVAGANLVHSVRIGLFFRQDDTRTLATRRIESTIPAGSTILVQPYSVVLTPSREGLLEGLAHNLGDPARASTKFRLQLALDPYPEPAYRLIYLGRGGLDAEKIYVDPAQLGGEHGLEPLRRLGVTFVVLKRYNGSADPETAPLAAALAREGQRIAVFSPYRPDTTAAEQARVDPFLHNTDTRIEDALERPGPPLEIWQIDGPGS